MPYNAEITPQIQSIRNLEREREERVHTPKTNVSVLKGVRRISRVSDSVYGGVIFLIFINSLLMVDGWMDVSLMRV
ncbi:hypothetical protein QVD17_00997 [Tagetes erecta]|uniref:Uncharacterized protein n=1 Tax=Tagetes erecta TaxID=13708 RepID=A0AAD8L9S6_TARER|nr:hypothetical protein QVD17_00997 [Tagetes erecta]